MQRRWLYYIQPLDGVYVEETDKGNHGPSRCASQRSILFWCTLGMIFTLRMIFDEERTQHMSFRQQLVIQRQLDILYGVD